MCWGKEERTYRKRPSLELSTVKGAFPKTVTKYGILACSVKRTACYAFLTPFYKKITNLYMQKQRQFEKPKRKMLWYQSEFRRKI